MRSIGFRTKVVEVFWKNKIEMPMIKVMKTILDRLIAAVVASIL
jgi:hypothetical protein